MESHHHHHDQHRPGHESDEAALAELVDLDAEVLHSYLSGVIEWVGAEVSRALPPSEIISPHGEPRDPMRSLVQQERPIVMLSLVFFGLALALFVALKVTLLIGTSATSSRMTKSSTISAAQAPAKP